MDTFAQVLTRLGVFAAHPAAFIVVFAYAALWLIIDHQTVDWHGGVAITTLLMTLLIQRAEHRDTQAIHAKLDELLRAEHRARSDLMRIDEQEPETIQQHRSQERSNLSE